MRIRVNLPHFGVKFVLGVDCILDGIERLFLAQKIRLERCQYLGVFLPGFCRFLFCEFSFLRVAENILKLVQLQELAEEVDDELIFRGFKGIHIARGNQDGNEVSVLFRDRRVFCDGAEPWKKLGSD